VRSNVYQRVTVGIVAELERELLKLEKRDSRTRGAKGPSTRRATHPSRNALDPEEFGSH
jgi:hypothetical protein